MYADLFKNYREFKTKDWRSEDDFDRIQNLLSEIAKHCDWLQEVLGDEVPGRGFNIEKYHKFLGWVLELRKLGHLGNGDTSRFEQQIKLLKKVVADEKIDEDLDARVIRKLSHLYALPKTSGGRKPRSDSRRLSRRRIQRRTSLSRGWGIPGDSLVWWAIERNLREGRHGVSVNEDILQVLPEATRRLYTERYGDDSEISVTRHVLVVSDSGEDMHNLKSGQCVNTTKGEYVQLLFPIVDVSVPNRQVEYVVLGFENVPYGMNGKYPEVPHLPWIQRRSCIQLYQLEELKQQVYVVKLFGHANRKRNDKGKHLDTNEHFLVNTGLGGRNQRATAKDVYRSCTRPSCSGMVLRPKLSYYGGGRDSYTRILEKLKVTCPTCNLEFTWL